MVHLLAAGAVALVNLRPLAPRPTREKEFAARGRTSSLMSRRGVVAWVDVPPVWALPARWVSLSNPFKQASRSNQCLDARRRLPPCRCCSE